MMHKITPRARLLSRIAVGCLLGLVLFIGGSRSDVTAQEADLPATLPNGIAAGDVTPTSAVLWARSTAPGPVEFTVALPRNEEMTVQVPAVDASRPVTTVMTGLRPGRAYAYTVTTATGDQMSGRFSTPVLAGSRGLRFGVGGDGRGDWLPFVALSNAPARNLDFFVYLGDTVYADIPSPAVTDPAFSLEQFRLKHAEVHTTRFGRNTLAELRQSTALFATIDDHEIMNDFAGGALASSSRHFPESTGLINDSQRFESGLQAFQEYYPLAAEYYGREGGDGRMDGERRLYRMRTFGQDAALFILDARSFRDAPLDRPDMSSTSEMDRFLRDAYIPDRTLLGERQMADLKRDLLAAKLMGITWKIIAIPQPIQQMLIGSVSDRYEGYAAERAELLAFIHEREIENVVFVAADVHGTLVNNLSYQPSYVPGGDQILTSAWEISVSSVAASGPIGPGIAVQARQQGWLSSEEWDRYWSLPVRNDVDNDVNDQDDYIKALLDEQLRARGYPSIGLHDGPVPATLLRGDYIAAHTFGWTEFQIARDTQLLTVTTYGVAPYTGQDLAEDVADVVARTPKVVSRFEVAPVSEAEASYSVFLPAIEK